MVKLCKDCKHIEHRLLPKEHGIHHTTYAMLPYAGEDAKCFHPKAEFSLVTGQSKTLCTALRLGLCGIAGTLWEPKEEVTT